jgi:O-antigen ligase
MSRNNNNVQTSAFTFEIIVWWFFSFAVVLVSKFEAFNQIVLKGVVPFTFLLLIGKNGGFSLKNRGFVLYVVLFLWACLSLIFTINMDMTLKYLQMMLGNIIIWYIVITIIEKSTSVQQLLIPLFIILVIHMYFGFSIVPDEDVPANSAGARAQGLSSNANALGFFMWYGVVVAYLLFLISRKLLFKILYIAAIALMVVVLLKSGSRKSLIALVVFFVSLMIFSGKKSNYALLIFLGIVVVISFGFLYDWLVEHTVVGARLNSESLERGTEGRSNLVMEGLGMFFSSPIVGIGLGCFTSFSSSGLMAHNDYIEIIASMGLPAILIYAFIFVDYFKKCWELRRNPQIFKLTLVAIAFGVGYLFLGLGRPAFLDAFAIFMLAFFQGLVTKAYNDYKLEEYYEDLPYHEHARLER